MEWRELKENGEYKQYLPEIWQSSLKMPKFIQLASKLWTPTFASFKKWAAKHQEIHGLFDGDDLMMLIYIEKQDSPQVAVIHMDRVRKIDAEDFVAMCSQLRDRLFHRGVKRIVGWTLKKNFALVRLMTAIGFSGTGCRLAHGEAHGKVLRWELLQVRAG